jgi:hypothetical protein
VGDASDVPEDWEQEKALRRRLVTLADAAQLPLPSVEVVADRKRWKEPAYVLGEPGEEPHIHVTQRLLTAGAAEQDWYLAACLAWWASPIPRRRARQGMAVYGAALVPHAVFGLGQLGQLWHLPKPVAVTVGLLVGVVLLVAHSFAIRYAQRGLEEAGHDVLRAAGRDPAAVARQAFGGQGCVPWFRRPLGIEPTPAQRIAAAERHQLRPQQPLF